MAPRRFCGPTDRALDAVVPGDWVGIVANAASGRGQGRVLVERLSAELAERGLRSEIAWTLDDRRELTGLAKHESGCRCLVAVGGDGTVGALVNERPTVPVTVLPAGTENLFAAQFGLRRSPGRLADAIVAGRVVTLDLGDSNGRRFSLMAGIGFDADVVTRHHDFRTRRTGAPTTTHRAAYVDPVLRSSFCYRFPKLRVTTDAGESLVGTSVFVFNLPRYALGLPFAPDASGTDGLLDVVVFRDGGAWPALRYLWLVFRGLHLRRPGIYHRLVKRASVEVESDATVPVQLDGDPGGVLTPGTDGARNFAAIPGAVEVLTGPASTSRLSQRNLQALPTRA